MDAKIEALEIKLAHQEDTLEKLNEALVLQQSKLVALEKKLTLLVELIKESDHNTDDNKKITHEIPPHY